MKNKTHESQQMIACLYKPFEHWAATGSVFLISDTHFGDADCPLMDPAWPSPEDAISLIKATAHKNDTLVHLGDVGDPSYMNALRCRKVLLMGNHDQGKTNYEPYFDEIYEGPLFIAPKILLSHEPIAGLDWCINIHGHDHADAFPKDNFHLNLASNICGYTPVSLSRLIKDGLLSDACGIHRLAIDKATERKFTRVEL